MNEIDSLDWAVELAERGWLADSQGWRVDLADQFSPMQADAVERGISGRQAGGLVSVSTTSKRSARPHPRSALHRARAQRRAEADSLYLAPDVDVQRVRDLRRAVGFAARALSVTGAAHVVEVCKMLTLTYRDGADWRPNHVRRLLDHIRKWSHRQGIPCRYVWVAELQKRGAIHYHIALFVPQGTVIPYPDKNGWWPHGWTNLEEARAAVPYLMKYLSKGTKADALRLPDGARMYGCGGLDHAMRRARRWLRLPAFVQARADIKDRWQRAPGGGWSDPDGVIWQSEFKRVKAGSFLAFERVTDHGRPFDPSGPFSWLPAAGAPQDGFLNPH